MQKTNLAIQILSQIDNNSPNETTMWLTLRNEPDIEHARLTWTSSSISPKLSIAIPTIIHPNTNCPLIGGESIRVAVQNVTWI